MKSLLLQFECEKDESSLASYEIDEIAENSLLPYDYLYETEYNGSEDYDSSLDWFKEVAYNNNWDINILDDNETIIFGTNFKKSYFKDRLEKFKSIVLELSENDFYNDTNLSLYNIKSLIEDTLSFRVIIGNECISFDEFVRGTLNDQESTTYYLKSITKYHF